MLSRKLIAIALFLAGLIVLVDVTRVGWLGDTTPGFDKGLYFGEAVLAPLLLTMALLVDGRIPLYGMDVLVLLVAVGWGVFALLLFVSSHEASILERGFCLIAGYALYVGGLWFAFGEARREGG